MHSECQIYCFTAVVANCRIANHHRAAKHGLVGITSLAFQTVLLANKVVYKTERQSQNTYSLPPPLSLLFLPRRPEALTSEYISLTSIFFITLNLYQKTLQQHNRTLLYNVILKKIVSFLYHFIKFNQEISYVVVNSS